MGTRRTATAFVVALALVSLVACGGGGSPSAPAPVTTTTTTTLPPIWSQAGSGNNVFNMPAYVQRVAVTGIWNGSGTSNFIVRVAGRLVINEILRDMPNRTYTGTHLVTGGGLVEITNSSAITWTFTEVR